jgi:hypothetical protein
VIHLADEFLDRQFGSPSADRNSRGEIQLDFGGVKFSSILMVSERRRNFRRSLKSSRWDKISFIINYLNSLVLAFRMLALLRASSSCCKW